MKNMNIYENDFCLMKLFCYIKAKIINIELVQLNTFSFTSNEKMKVFNVELPLQASWTYYFRITWKYLFDSHFWPYISVYLLCDSYFMTLEMNSYLLSSESDPDPSHKMLFHHKRRYFERYNDTNDSILEKYQNAESN